MHPAILVAFPDVHYGSEPTVTAKDRAAPPLSDPSVDPVVGYEYDESGSQAVVHVQQPNRRPRKFELDYKPPMPIPKTGLDEAFSESELRSDP